MWNRKKKKKKEHKTKAHRYKEQMVVDRGGRVEVGKMDGVKRYTFPVLK